MVSVNLILLGFRDNSDIVISLNWFCFIFIVIAVTERQSQTRRGFKRKLGANE